LFNPFLVWGKFWNLDLTLKIYFISSLN
jgi:hypothetical protein